MSYTAFVGGYFTIQPELKWSEIRNSKFYLDNKPQVSRTDPGIVLRVDSNEVETDEGVNTALTCSYAVPWRESFDCRALDEDADALVKAMEEIGRTVRGEMVVQPRDYGDGGIWRVVIDEEGARKEMARLQWPDGSEVELP